MTLLKLEIKRIYRNRRGLIFTIGLPIVFLFIFATRDYGKLDYGVGNVAANVTIGLTLYGAIMACTTTGATVSLERQSGWSRQLRLTPLRPWTYILIKCAAGLLMSLVTVVLILAFAPAAHAQMPAAVWAETALIMWAGSVVFLAFGLALGYLLPADITMQVIGTAMALLALLGGLFMPLEPGTLMDTIGSFTPLYGLHKLALAPLGAGDFTWTAVVNVIAWGTAFIAISAWAMARDTQRV